jgi:hypothetical protein
MANLLSTNVSGRLYTSGHVDTAITNAAFRFYDGTTFRGGLGLDDWAHSGSAANITMYVNGDNNFFISTSGVKRAQFNSGAAIFRTYSADNAHNIRITGGDQFNAYYNDGATTLYLQYHGGSGGTLNVANGKLTVNTAGSVVASGDMRAPIFYDSNNTSYYLDPNSTTSGYFAGVLRQNDGKYVRDSSYRTISGYSDYYSGGAAGWYRAAEIRLTSNCTGAVLYGTLYDHRYDGADSYQISIVARAECSFTSDNNQHYINVGCTVTGSTAISNYRDKIRLVLVEASSNSRTYELQFYETNWNHDTWQLETTGWTVYSSPQAPRASVAGDAFIEVINYISNQGADYQRANSAMYSPIYYDSNDNGFYLDPNGTSNLNKFSERTMAFNGMNPRSANSPYVARYDGSVGYRNGTMGYANTDFNTIARNWGSGFIDTWSSPANAPGGSSHYIGLQGVHYSDGGTSFYGFQMACAGEADNRFFWRSSWPSMRSWVEMIHSGNIASQSVSYAVTSGTSSATTQTNFSSLTVGGLDVATREYVTSQGYLTSLPSHNHDDRYYTETESDGRYLRTGSDSEQEVGLRYASWNAGAARMNTDPRWNESGYDADLGCLHIWAWTAGGSPYGRAGIALYNGSAYQYLTTRSGATGMFVNNQEIIHSGNIGSQSVASATDASTLGGFGRGNTTNKIAYFDGTRNLYVNNPESYTGEVRLGAAWSRGGVYASGTLSMSTSGGAIDFVSNDTTVGAFRWDSTNGSRFIVGQNVTTTPHTLIDSNRRPVIYTRGAYPVITLDHTETGNGLHGPTIQFAHNGLDGRQFVIGTNGSGTNLDFGFSDTPSYGNTSYNPHNGIGGYNGKTIMRLTSTGLLIGDTGSYPTFRAPGRDLDVRGSQNISGVLNVNGATEHAINDNNRVVGSSTNNTVFINGSIQLTNNNDAIVIGRGTATFLSDEELGFGWGGGWYMTEGSYIRSRGSKSLHMNGGSVDYVGSLYLEGSGVGVHLQPNAGSYGSLQVSGSKDGWHGVRFTGSNVVVMANTNEVGFHNNNAGWQFLWSAGTAYVYKGGTGGGTQATVWDSSNAPRANLSDLMHYEGFTLDANSMRSNSTGFTYSNNAPETGPIARFSTGGGYDLWINAGYWSGSDLWFRTRNGDTASINAWRRNLNATSDFYAANMNQYVRTSDSVTFGGVTSPTILVNNQSDNTKGYRIWNTSNTSVSAMFVNSSNQLVIAAGAVDQVNLNKKVYVNGVALGVNVAPSATAGRIDASNDIVAYSSSDERLKHNITPIENALDKVKSLTGVEFDWKPEYKHAHGYEGHDTGIIAQQVQDVMPSAVRTNDTGFLAVRYEKLIGLLIEGMKEQQAQIDELKAKLDGLTK